MVNLLGLTAFHEGHAAAHGGGGCCGGGNSGHSDGQACGVRHSTLSGTYVSETSIDGRELKKHYCHNFLSLGGMFRRIAGESGQLRAASVRENHGYVGEENRRHHIGATTSFCIARKCFH